MITEFKTNKKTSRQNIFFSAILIVSLFTLVGFLVVSDFRINKKRADLTSMIAELKNDIQVLEARRQELGAGLSQSGREDYLEKEARERLNLKKEGEEVVVVVPSGESEKTKSAEQNFWDRILDVIR